MGSTGESAASEASNNGFGDLPPAVLHHFGTELRSLRILTLSGPVLPFSPPTTTPSSRWDQTLQSPELHDSTHPYSPARRAARWSKPMAGPGFSSMSQGLRSSTKICHRCSFSPFFSPGASRAHQGRRGQSSSTMMSALAEVRTLPPSLALSLPL